MDDRMTKTRCETCRFAYADPPYIGQAKKHYSHDDRCAEVNHEHLLQTLERDYDFWALSCSSPSLRKILALCPEGVRIAAWVKPFAIFKPNVNPAYAWEPIIFKPSARKRLRTEKTIRDWVSCNITLKRGLVGVKPDAVCHWLFDLLGAKPTDQFHDIFPGSGAVSNAWKDWCGEHQPRQEGGDSNHIPDAGKKVQP